MKKPTSPLNSNAFTLVEVLVAMVILMVGLLALLQTINLAIVTNTQNEMRTQATAIAEERMAQRKSLPFDSISTGVQRSDNVPVSMRSSFVNYSAFYRGEDIPSLPGNPVTAKRLNVGVRWHFKGNSYEHVVTTIVTRPVTN